MSDLTWQVMATVAGAALVVTAITQFIKSLTVNANINPRLIAYAASLVVLNLAYYFTGTWTVSAGTLSLFISLGVAAMALGEYEVMKTAGIYKSSTQIVAMRMNNKAV